MNKPKSVVEGVASWVEIDGHLPVGVRILIADKEGNLSGPVRFDTESEADTTLDRHNRLLGPTRRPWKYFVIPNP